MAGKGIEFLSPIGRLVQGGVTLETKTDMQTGQAKRDAQGNEVKECYLAVAFRKDDAAWPAFYGVIYNAARAEFPHLVGADGSIAHPKFAMKVMDGDGVDSNGVSVAGKAGFAGHWIVKMGTQYLPACFHAGKYDASQRIQNPEQVIKRGYFVRVGGTIRGNGAKPGTMEIPGVFISPNLVEFVAFGDEITSGPDAAKMFGAAPIGALPPGASAVPTGGTAAGMAPPPAPNAAPPPAAPAAGYAPPPPVAAPPAPPAAVQAPPAPIAAPPAPPAGPQLVMTAKAQGVDAAGMRANGWTDAAMIEHGYAVLQ